MLLTIGKTIPRCPKRLPVNEYIGESRLLGDECTGKSWLTSHEYTGESRHPCHGYTGESSLTGDNYSGELRHPIVIQGLWVYSLPRSLSRCLLSTPWRWIHRMYMDMDMELSIVEIQYIWCRNFPTSIIYGPLEMSLQPYNMELKIFVLTRLV